MDHYPPGTVVALAHDAARFTNFSVSISGLAKDGMPPGSTLAWGIGISVAESLNKAVRQFLESDGSWFFIMGDDHSFGTDLLYRLLDREHDVIVPLCLWRYPPLHPVAWANEGAIIDLAGHTEGGLVEVEMAGSAGMLITREVIEALDDPWFEYGQINSELLSEDLYFCKKVRAAGFRIVCDLDNVLGHITPLALFPRLQEGQWQVAMKFPQGQIVSFPYDTFYPSEVK